MYQIIIVVAANTTRAAEEKYKFKYGFSLLHGY